MIRIFAHALPVAALTLTLSSIATAQDSKLVQQHIAALRTLNKPGTLVQGALFAHAILWTQHFCFVHIGCI